MKITFEITRKDLWKQRWWAKWDLPLNRNLYILFYLYWIWEFSDNLPKDKGVFSVIIYIFLVSILFCIFIVALDIVLFVIDIYLSNKYRGVICEHMVEITVDGLREITEANDTFRRWEYIDKIKESKKYIYWRVGHQYLGIPKRAFVNKLEAEEFYQQMLLFWEDREK